MTGHLLGATLSLASCGRTTQEVARCSLEKLGNQWWFKYGASTLLISHALLSSLEDSKLVVPSSVQSCCWATKTK